MCDIMSDLWSFPSCSPPPMIHHSSLPQSSPLSSCSSPGNHGNAPHAKVPSYLFSPHLSEPQVTSPQVTSLQLSHPQGTSPHIGPETQVSSPHLLYQYQEPSPHCAPWSQVTSNHLFPQGQVTSPQLPPCQVTSPHLQHVTSPQHLPHHQVTSPHLQHVTSPQHLPHHQVTSPHLQHVTSPQHLPHHQVTSPHLQHVTSPQHLLHHQVTSPHLQHVTSPQHLPHHQVTSPHLQHVTSPQHLPHHQVTSPFLSSPYVTSLHLVSQPQITSPHLLPLSQHHLSNQNHDPGSDPDWIQTPELPYLQKSYSYSYQNQNLDFHLQNQNQFSTGVTHHRDEVETTHRLPYNTHTLVASGVDVQDVTPGPVQDTWQGPTLRQPQCPPLGSLSGEVVLGRWSSVEVGSSPAADSSGTQFFHDSCHDNNAPQPFCSPNTPGPSPHYPQTPTISSPGPQMQERADYHTQTFRQLSREKTLTCCRQEYDGYATTSDPAQHHPPQMSQHHLQSQTKPIQQDRTGTADTAGNAQGRGQDVSSTAQSPGPSAGLSWGGESGGGGGRRGRGRGGGNGQPDWTWMKRPQSKNSTEVLDTRLMCMVCKRDFRSLPALNGHMRSHSGSRAATCSNKVHKHRLTHTQVLPLKAEDSTPPMVIPVTVPVLSSVKVKAGKGGERKCSRLSPSAGHAVLYRSLLRHDEEEAAAKGDGDEALAEDGVTAVSVGGVVTRGDGVSGVHYTPPPMLCPVRAGPGLYCSLTTRRQQRVQTVQLHNVNNGLCDLVATETASPPGTRTSGISKPQINVGRSFQAEIPPLRDQKHAHSDSHNALLLWMPWDELERPVNQQRVQALLMMAHSSVMPGAGANPESALYVLSECRGDFLLTVEKLLSPAESSNNNHAARQYPSWSAAERRSLVKSLQLHHKDFSRIQKAVQTKSLSQCVEFYYLWKKTLSLSAGTPTGLTVTLPDSNGQR